MRPPIQFGDNIAAEAENEPDPRMVSMMICTQMAGRAVIRVVGRCNEAKCNNNLENYTIKITTGKPSADFERTAELKIDFLQGNGPEHALGKLGQTIIVENCWNFPFYLTMASAVTRVVHRCNDAQETQNLDLSNCQLMQVPDAVYHLMRHTELKTCDLSDNVITKIPPKFAVKFHSITDLNLSHNQMSKLPDEIADLSSLERLDISHNTFISIPNCIFKISKLQQLNASNNHIMDVEVECLEQAPSLQIVDLSSNPLVPRCHDQLSKITKIRLTLSPREKEDWEDLTI